MGDMMLSLLCEFFNYYCLRAPFFRGATVGFTGSSSIFSALRNELKEQIPPRFASLFCSRNLHGFACCLAAPTTSSVPLVLHSLRTVGSDGDPTEVSAVALRPELCSQEQLDNWPLQHIFNEELPKTSFHNKSYDPVAAVSGKNIKSRGHQFIGRKSRRQLKLMMRNLRVLFVPLTSFHIDRLHGKPRHDRGTTCSHAHFFFVPCNCAEEQNKD
jgi:hypothetical protein